MKRKIYAPLTALGLTAIIAGAVLIGAGSRADAANVVANPSFDSDIANWTVGAGLNVTPSRDTVLFDTGPASFNFDDATSSADLVSVDSDCMQSLSAGLYDFSARFQGNAGNDAGSTAQVQLEVFTSSNCSTGSSTSGTSTTPGTGASFVTLGSTGVAITAGGSAVLHLHFDTPSGIESKTGNWDTIILDNTNPATQTPTVTATNTVTPTVTNTPTNTPVPPTNTATATSTNTPVPPTNTPTATGTATQTNTPGPTNTPTNTPTVTNTATITNTPTVTNTPGPTNTPTNTPIATDTPIATNTAIPTSTNTPDATQTMDAQTATAEDHQTATAEAKKTKTAVAEATQTAVAESEALAAQAAAAATQTAVALTAPGLPPESGVEPPANDGDVAGEGDEAVDGLPDTGTGAASGSSNSAIALLIALTAVAGGASIFVAMGRKKTDRQ